MVDHVQWKYYKIQTYWVNVIIRLSLDVWIHDCDHLEEGKTDMLENLS